MAKRKRNRQIQTTAQPEITQRKTQKIVVPTSEKYDQQVSRWFEAEMFADSMISGFPRDYHSNPRALDQWLIQTLDGWDWLQGAFAKVTAFYANKGWEITGGHRLTLRTADVLHDARSLYSSAVGWRPHKKAHALSYLARTEGAFVGFDREAPARFRETKLGREWILPTVTGIYNMDTERTRWTLNTPATPLGYGNITFNELDFYHMTSMPGDTAATARKGRSPLYRCIRSLMLMVAMHQYELGNLDPHFVDGILLVKGVDRDNFWKANKEREVTDRVDGGNPAKRILAIFKEFAGVEEDLDAKLIDLRQSPTTFNNFIDRMRLVQEACALNLGFHPTFFGIGQGNSLLGQSSSEVQSSDQVTARTGAAEFHLEDQEHLQRHFHDVHFEYEGEAVEDDVALLLQERQSAVFKNLFEATNANGESLMDRDEVRALMAHIDPGLYESLTPVEDDVTVTDESEDNIDEEADEIDAAPDDEIVSEAARKRIIERTRDTVGVSSWLEKIRSGQAKDEPYVQYIYRSQNGVGVKKVLTLAPSAADLMRKRVWHINRDQVQAVVRPTEQQVTVRSTAAGQDLIRRQSIDEIYGLDVFGDIESLVEVALRDQYEAADLEAILNELEGNLDDLEAALPVIERNSTPVSEYVDQGVLVGLLLTLALRGIDDALVDAPVELASTQRINLEGDLEAYLTERVASLTEGNPADAVPGNLADFTNPYIENTLDPESYRQVGRALRDNDAGDLAAVAAALVLLATSRAERIAVTEAGNAYRQGQYQTGVILKATHKEWLPTTSAQPRDIHRAQYNVVVPIDQPFPSGEYAPQSVPECKCGMRLIWR